MLINRIDQLKSPYMTISLFGIYSYVTVLTVNFLDVPSAFGLMIFATIISQLLSGIALSFSLVPEGNLIPAVRDEEDLENMFIDDFFWLHERGVDFIFIFSFFHIFRKMYLVVFDYENEASWRSGMFSFMIFHVVVFLGLVLCCTHLSEITLTIAANIMHTAFGFYGKPYWWLFTDRQLNTDTLIRLAYAHYLSAFYFAYLGYLHSLEMHYDWKTEATNDGLTYDLTWWNEVLLFEIKGTTEVLILFVFIGYYLYPEPESLSYELFMWGDIGIMNDIRFYSVAPHWYFRPYMAWLLACPYHKTGIFGLLFFIGALYFQPNLHGMSDTDGLDYTTSIWWSLISGKWSLPTDQQNAITVNFYRQLTYSFFFMCALYTTSFLPYGRFYHRIGGNIAMLYSYMFVFIYLSCTSLRNPTALHLMHHNLIKKSLRLNIKVSKKSKCLSTLPAKSAMETHTKWERVID